MDDGLKGLICLVAGALVLVGGMKLALSLTRPGYLPDPIVDAPPGCRNVALLGDSLSAGPLYRIELEELLGLCSASQAFAYPNQGTGFVRSKLSTALAWGPTDLVVLAGVNDLASGRKVSLVIDNLEWIYETAQQYGVRVVAVTLTPWAGHTKGKKLQYATQEVNDWISWQSSADVVVDTSSLGNDFGVAHDSLVGSDGLHLTEAGQMALATAVYTQAFGE